MTYEINLHIVLMYAEWQVWLWNDKLFIQVVSYFLQNPDSNGIISLWFGTQVQEIRGLKSNSSTCSFI